MDAFPYHERVHGAGFCAVNIKSMWNSIVKGNTHEVNCFSIGP